MSASALPFKRTPPAWMKLTTADVTDLIMKLARKGLTPSQIGVILRDQHGVAQTRFVTGSKILRILRKNGMFLIVSWIGGFRFSFCLQSEKRKPWLRLPDTIDSPPFLFLLFMTLPFSTRFVASPILHTLPSSHPI